MLKLINITKRYGEVTAVEQVSLEIPDGRMVGIIGRSGAGKSTLLSMINRLVEPGSGKIFYQDQEITQLKGKALLRWRAQCAMIFQQFNLVNRISVLDNVLTGRLNYNQGLFSLLKKFPAVDRALAIRALDRLGMAEFAFQRAEQLSGGQQQRVAIAKALVQSPQIVLADEPIASLDPHNAKMVMEALYRMNKENKITVIASLHTLDTARKYCDRIIGMARGNVVFDGTTEALTPEILEQIYGPPQGLHDGERQIDSSITSVSMAADSNSTLSSL